MKCFTDVILAYVKSVFVSSVGTPFGLIVNDDGVFLLNYQLQQKEGMNVFISDRVKSDCLLKMS